MIRKKPKPHDHDDVKQHYYEHENEKSLGNGVQKMVCCDCLGAGGLACCDDDEQDTYDVCHSCEGHGEWTEVQF